MINIINCRFIEFIFIIYNNIINFNKIKYYYHIVKNKIYVNNKFKKKFLYLNIFLKIEPDNIKFL